MSLGPRKCPDSAETIVIAPAGLPSTSSGAMTYERRCSASRSARLSGSSTPAMIISSVISLESSCPVRSTVYTPPGSSGVGGKRRFSSSAIASLLRIRRARSPRARASHRARARSIVHQSPSRGTASCATRANRFLGVDRRRERRARLGEHARAPQSRGVGRERRCTCRTTA